MFVITCSTCRQRHLVGSRAIEVFVNTIDGPVATVRCPAGHEVHHHFRFPAGRERGAEGAIAAVPRAEVCLAG